MGAGVVASGYSMTSQAFAAKKDALEQISFAFEDIPDIFERNTRNLAVNSNAWKAVGVGDVLEARGEDLRSDAIDEVRRLALAAAVDADEDRLREFAAIERAGQVEAELGLWTPEALDAWADKIVSLETRISEVAQEVETDLVAAGLPQDEAAMMARGLLETSSIQARFGDGHPMSRPAFMASVDEMAPEKAEFVDLAFRRIDEGLGGTLNAVMARANFQDKPVTVAMDF
jgi:hypothetical protein